MGLHQNDAPGRPVAFGGDDLVAVMRAYRDVLERHRGALNRLNVYPVPDGDTGTNMALTLQSVVEALEGAASLDLAGVTAVIARGALMGARGNSGVILCQILRGFSASVAGLEAVDAPALAVALEAAAREARAAVLRPMEGTILTVASGAAEGAAGGAAEVLEVGGSSSTRPVSDLAVLLERARAGAVAALHRTPDLLPVLAEAGVVDAGGAGLVLLLDAFLHVVDGRPLPEELDLPDAVQALLATGTAPPTTEATVESPTSLRYEVMYLLEADDGAIPAFKQVWAGLGDSIVVVGGDGLWNCHVHTDDIGGAIEAALDVGRPREIRVTDLAEQVEEERWVRQGAASPEVMAATPEEPRRTSVVAVATGQGIRRIFTSLGVRDVVAGGQSMNPSTADLLAAVEAASGAEVVLLPNNSNIWPVADQVASLTDKPVAVVRTAGIQEGFAALLEYDPQGTARDNAEAMSSAAAAIVAGEVTRAVRAAETAAGRVEPGDWLGLSRHGVEVVATTAEQVLEGLLGCLLEPDHEIVTLIEGDGATASVTRAVTEWLHERHPRVTVERHSGGQPLYPYLVSIE